MVTAELAVAILAALALLSTLLWGLLLAVTQVRCQDTAAAVARQAARGDASGVRRAEAGAPRGAQVRVEHSAERVRVVVAVRVRPPLRSLPAVRLQARADVVPEPGADR